MIRPVAAVAIAALMSTAAMAQLHNAPITQPALKPPMGQSALSQMGPSTRFMATMPTKADDRDYLLQAECRMTQRGTRVATSR